MQVLNHLGSQQIFNWLRHYVWLVGRCGNQLMETDSTSVKSTSRYANFPFWDMLCHSQIAISSATAWLVCSPNQLFISAVVTCDHRFGKGVSCLFGVHFMTLFVWSLPPLHPPFSSRPLQQRLLQEIFGPYLFLACLLFLVQEYHWIRHLGGWVDECRS